MGGKIKVDGGMTKAEQEAMLNENRKYEEEQQLKREERLAAAELERKNEAAKAIQDVKNVEELKIEDLQSAATEISNEEIAQAKAKQMGGDGSGGQTLGNQFYDSLFNNTELYASKQKKPK